MTNLPHEYGALAHELLKRAAAIRQPANGTFELTSRCNLSCRMCYIRHPADDHVHRNMELPVSSWIALAHDAVDNGMVFLLLTGGEVFIRSDFFEIYEPLTRMGLVITLFTNGTLITEAVAKQLAQSPPSRTEITLYGATAATYETITGVPGSYTSCCSGIEALIKHRIPLGLKTTITRHNVGELDTMRRMAKEWGVPFSGGWLLSRRPDGRLSDVENCRLSASDCIALEATDLASLSEWAGIEGRESAILQDGNFYCQAGKAAFVVNPAGEMNVCLDLPFPAARPLETGFFEAWEEVQRYVDSMIPASSACLACAVRAYCGRCPAWSHMETGTFTEPVPYLCEIAHRRKEWYQRHE